MNEREKFYGKVVFDFVNAPSWNEGFFILLENVPAAFGFSQDAADKVRSYRRSCVVPPEENEKIKTMPSYRKAWQHYFLDISQNVTEIISALATGSKLPDLELKGDIHGRIDRDSPLDVLLLIYNRFKGHIVIEGDDFVTSSTMFNEE